MSARVTDRQLAGLVDRINALTGSPAAPWRSKGDGQGCAANVGNYHLSGSHFGLCLHRMSTDGGGVTTPLGLASVTRREIFERLRAFLAGLEYHGTSGGKGGAS